MAKTLVNSSRVNQLASTLPKENFEFKYESFPKIETKGTTVRSTDNCLNPTEERTLRSFDRSLAVIQRSKGFNLSTKKEEVGEALKVAEESKLRAEQLTQHSTFFSSELKQRLNEVLQTHILAIKRLQELISQSKYKQSSEPFQVQQGQSQAQQGQTHQPFQTQQPFQLFKPFQPQQPHQPHQPQQQSNDLLLDFEPIKEHVPKKEDVRWDVKLI